MNTNYDFDRIIDRRGTASYKWDIKDGELPLWVADMDFEAAPPIKDAIIKRAQHGVFGYNIVPDKWFDAYINWWRDRHHLEMDRSSLIFCTGVVPAISSTVRKLTTPGDNVVILTPVYNIFFNSIINNGCKVLEIPLEYKTGQVGMLTQVVEEPYEINFKLLEEALALKETKLLIFCNPHNPAGRIWTSEELAKVGELCAKHNVTVLSDEIHCDITDPGKEYIPFALASETCRNISITAISASKAFNLAGLQSAAVYVPNSELRNKINRALNTDEVAEPNSFAVDACIAAFTEGGPWLEALKDYLYENKKYAKQFISKNMPIIKVVPSKATYLMWVDIAKTRLDGDTFADRLRKQTGLYINGGNEYGIAGKRFVRINLACPRPILEDAMNRLKIFCDSSF